MQVIVSTTDRDKWSRGTPLSPKTNMSRDRTVSMGSLPTKHFLVHCGLGSGQKIVIMIGPRESNAARQGVT